MTTFCTFFRELHGGVCPYPWQEELARRLADGAVPAAVVVPTGGGKTATIDALVWALAAQADLPAADRTLGVRTVWAIDRRILVDEVYAHAQLIATRLTEALAHSDDPIHETATRLSLFTAGGVPLTASRWRGQVRVAPRAQHPFQPEIITSTVAQIGSRLLFRGYGVGEHSHALEAGLAAVDTTLCLDEAHLAEPFRQTVQAIRGARLGHEPRGMFGPLSVITLTATPMHDVDPRDIQTISAADEQRLGSRFSAPKHAVLVEPDGDNYKQRVDAFLDALHAQIEAGVRRLACVVNSVWLAAQVADQAKHTFGSRVDVITLVGPQRPWDRRGLLKDYHAAIFEKEAPDRPLLVVATQTIEVGLDADFEGMVTASASASALVQRFGRVNRAGDLPDAQVVIVRDRTSPLYERAEPVAWDWLASLKTDDGRIDISPRAIARAGGPPPDQSSRCAPALTDETIELWQQTSPPPAPSADPAIEPFLHGTDEKPSDDVSIAWRDDLRFDEQDAEASTWRQSLLQLAPPHRDELVAVSLRRFHALLATRFPAAGERPPTERAVADEPDVEGAADAAAATGTGSRPQFAVIRGRDVFEVGTAHPNLHVRDVRPGDVVVFDCSVGGYANDMLSGNSSATVEDVGNDAALQELAERGSARVRLNALRLPKSWDTVAANARALADGDTDPEGPEGRALLQALGVTTSVPVLDIRRVWGKTSTEPAEIWDDMPDEDAASGGSLDPNYTNSRDETFVLILGSLASLDQDTLRLRKRPAATLRSHASAVADRVASYAVGLRNAKFTATLRLAARAHDHGKADPRMQAYLQRGVAHVGEELVAKSADGSADRIADRRAARAAGLPRQLRHEISSVAILAQHAEKMDEAELAAVDLELALYLVGVHHGRGRPWPPMPSLGVPPRPFFVDLVGISGTGAGDGLDGWQEGAWLRRFFSVNRRYGAWGTAYLEAVLILADRCVSAEGA
jgi:CRISPR-associated endonuclease/helicase Cas3